MPEPTKFRSRSIRARRTNGNGDPGGGPMIIYGAVAAVVIIVMSFVLSITGLGTSVRTRLLTRSPQFLPVESDITVDFYAVPPLSGQAPHPVRLMNLSQGPIATCHWDFGDGSPVYEGCGGAEGITHTYTQPGVYTLILRVIEVGGEGFSAIRENYIVVRE